MVESMLLRLATETISLQNETNRVELLTKKKAWAHFDAQEDVTKSLITATELLKEQQRQETALLHSFGNTIERAGADTLTGKAL